MPRKYAQRMKRPPQDRFWEKVDKDGAIPETHPELGPCWTWKPNKNGGGYGSFWDGERSIPAHRFAYVLEYGPIDDELNVDHICHNRACVRASHLRAATLSQNQMNSVRPISNKSGFKGVSRASGRRKFTAQISTNNRTRYLGTFDTPEAAHEIYKAAAIELHGEFANFGAHP